MNNKKFETYFDCGLSKIRAGSFGIDNLKNIFYEESEFFFNHLNIESEIQKIIISLEKKTKEYLDSVNLMIDSNKMLSVGISISKKIDGSNLKKEDIKFLIQDAKQQVLRNHNNQNIVHIIIKNYKIDGIKYTLLPSDIKCNLISLDILFICLPKETTEYYKKIFFKLGISVGQIFCSSYAKSINYKNNFSSTTNMSFVDIGFNKTSITCYVKDEIISLSVLPIGGNHITKDIANILKIKLENAEKIKLCFDKNQNFLDEKKISIDLIQKIIFARIEEILELSLKIIKINLKDLDKFKMVLMGSGSAILDNEYKEKISFSNKIDFLEETTDDICRSGLKLSKAPNMQEVVLIPQKYKKKGFFEKLFHRF